MASTLGLVSGTCTAGAGLLAVRWIPRRTDSLGRQRAFPVYGVSVLLMLAIVAAVPSAQRRVQERRLASVAATLAGRHVTVHCQTTTGELVDAGAELGYVPYDENGLPRAEMVLKHAQCSQLAHYAGGDQPSPSFDEMVAVHVLTHESMHVRGETSEAVAECQAIQRDVQTAALLGADEAAAQRLAKAYLSQVYPRMVDSYVTPDCRADGPLDEHLNPSVWSPEP